MMGMMNKDRAETHTLLAGALDIYMAGRAAHRNHISGVSHRIWTSESYRSRRLGRREQNALVSRVAGTVWVALEEEYGNAWKT